jgi:hypothetical protein
VPASSAVPGAWAGSGRLAALEQRIEVNQCRDEDQRADDERDEHREQRGASTGGLLDRQRRQQDVRVLRDRPPDEDAMVNPVTM